MSKPADPLKDYNLRAALQGRITFADNMLAAIVEIPCTSGAETAWKNPRFRPIGFLPLKAVDSDGVLLELATVPVFNDRPIGGDGKVKDGFFGLTVTYTSGTDGTVTGILVGG